MTTGQKVGIGIGVAAVAGLGAYLLLRGVKFEYTKVVPFGY